ncbi:MAG: GNAT family N-acetyltransferase [Actinomycetota bacterium]|nr:GNAT family N-acetyltransferase [Actinomycetota bacterium]
MGKLQIRPMTSDDFDVYRRRTIREYAAEHVRAGDWRPEDAEQRAAKETDDLLPDGAETPGMVLLVGENDHGAVGLVWVGPGPDQRPGWWIYDIEVVDDQRGQGFGRALLEAAEHEVKRRGGDSVGLNVFGGNEPARCLYESSGYYVTSIQMRKRLSP